MTLHTSLFHLIFKNKYLIKYFLLKNKETIGKIANNNDKKIFF